MPEDAAVAVVGMAAIFPGASNLAGFWRNVRDGLDATSDVPADRWDPVFFDPAAAGVDRFACRRGGFVDTQAVLDPVALGIVPSAIDASEPDQLLSLALAAEALADAGGEARVGDRSRTAVIVGRGGYLTPGLARLDQRVRTSEQLVVALHSLLPELSEAELAEVKRAFVERLGPDRPGAAIDLVPNLAASRIANRFDLHGPAYTVDAACASSLVAVDHAVRELTSGRCDLALAGGVHLCHDVTLWSVFSQLGALSEAQCIRPFDRRADGLLIGEGGAMIVLERLEDAERSGAHVYAVIRGVGISSDGRSGSLMRPGVDGQVLALQRAWEVAERAPEQVGLLEAHGTGTAAGDAAEVETLRRFFGPATADRPRAGLGSVKSMIGHAMPAAGAAGLVKAIMAVHDGVLPPTLHCEEPLPALSETRFEPITTTRPWPDTDGPRLAAVDAFGFGGINAHVVVEEHGFRRGRRTRVGARNDARGPAPTDSAVPARPVSAPEPVLLVAADSPEALLASLTDEAGRMAAAGGPPNVPPGAGPVRLAVLDPTAERLALARKVVTRATPWRGRQDTWFTTGGLASAGGAVALVFPGVEPTFEPRLDDVASHFAMTAPRSVAADAAATDLEGLGRAIVGVARVLHGALGSMGVPCDLMAGQSIGEWSGMIASEMVPAEEVDRFIGSLHPGSLEVPGVVFAALGCGVDAVTDALEDLGTMSISHDNCPHQTVVCGPEVEVQLLLERMRSRRVIGQVLPFRSGFHSPLFASFLDPFRTALSRLPLQPGTVPLWSATTCAPYPTDPDAVRDLALAHLVEPVRFRELTLALYEHGARVFVQVGTGALVGMIEDTLQGRDMMAIAANSPKRSGMGQLYRVAASLWVEGVDGIEWGALFGPPGASPVQLRRLPLSTPLVRMDPLARTAGQSRRPSGGPRIGGPVGAELDALFSELAETTSAIEDALRAPPLAAPPEAAPLTDPAVIGPAQSPAAVVRRRVPLSVDTVPALADHCFYRQPAGWPSMSDRFPVVPMTMLVEMMIDAAREAFPDAVAVAVEDVLALRWLAVAPQLEVDVRAEPLPGPDAAGARSVRVVIDSYARATVVMGPSYPEAPEPALLPLGETEPLPTNAERLYEERWLFHGPAYRGVQDLGPMGPSGIDGTISVGEAPGAVLDNAGQLMGFWVMSRQSHDRLALPVSIRRLELFGPRPPVGTSLVCRVRVRRIDGEGVETDLELTDAGRLWARVEGWFDRRFESDERVWPVLLFPERNDLAELHDGGALAPGGFVVARERWRSSASRELMMRRYLGEAERSAYEGHNPRAQRLHLLGRIAAKDAARRRWWADGGGDCHPVEVVVSNDEEGRPILGGRGAKLKVSIAHTQWVGVAMVTTDGAPGIDVERIEARSDGFAGTAFETGELSMLLDGHDEDQRSEWLTRGWAAKEAYSKALGTGLQFAPKRMSVTAIEGEEISVDGHPVATTRIDDLVVAWTVRHDR